MKWLAAELHCHTFHSDGRQSPEQLWQAAQAQQLDFVALTDHNTDSAVRAFPFIPGIEWTTYHGHMTVLGAREYVDWRDIASLKLDDKLRAIHAADGLCTVAHPYSEGSPLCTGCHWDYQTDDPSLIDGWEIWHDNQPWLLAKNRRSIAAWQSLLDRGCQIAGVYGLDWHVPPQAKHAAATYLYADETAGIEGALAAIAAARTLVTAGPLPLVTARQEGHLYQIGDTLAPGQVRLDIDVDFTARRACWQHRTISVDSVSIIGNGGIVLAKHPWQGQPLQFTLRAQPGWLRAQINGRIDGVGCAIAHTSALYVAPLNDPRA